MGGPGILGLAIDTSQHVLMGFPNGASYSLATHSFCSFFDPGSQLSLPMILFFLNQPEFVLLFAIIYCD